jgi:hypothetical protein
MWSSAAASSPKHFCFLMFLSPTSALIFLSICKLSVDPALASLYGYCLQVTVFTSPPTCDVVSPLGSSSPVFLFS